MKATILMHFHRRNLRIESITLRGNNFTGPLPEGLTKLERIGKLLQRRRFGHSYALEPICS